MKSIKLNAAPFNFADITFVEEDEEAATVIHTKERKHFRVDMSLEEALAYLHNTARIPIARLEDMHVNPSQVLFVKSCGRGSILFAADNTEILLHVPARAAVRTLEKDSGMHFANAGQGHFVNKARVAGIKLEAPDLIRIHFDNPKKYSIHCESRTGLLSERMSDKDPGRGRY